MSYRSRMFTLPSYCFRQIRTLEQRQGLLRNGLIFRKHFFLHYFSYFPISRAAIVQILAIPFPISTSLSFSFMVHHLLLVTYFKGNLILTISKSFFSYIILVFSPSRFVPFLTFFILTIIFFIPKSIS